LCETCFKFLVPLGLLSSFESGIWRRAYRQTNRVLPFCTHFILLFKQCIKIMDWHANCLDFWNVIKTTLKCYVAVFSPFEVTVAWILSQELSDVFFYDVSLYLQEAIFRTFPCECPSWMQSTVVFLSPLIYYWDKVLKTGYWIICNANHIPPDVTKSVCQSSILHSKGREFLEWLESSFHSSLLILHNHSTISYSTVNNLYIWYRNIYCKKCFLLCSDSSEQGLNLSKLRSKPHPAHSMLLAG